MLLDVVDDCVVKGGVNGPEIGEGAGSGENPQSIR